MRDKKMIIVLLICFSSIVLSQNLNSMKSYSPSPPPKAVGVFWITVLGIASGGVIGLGAHYLIQAPNNPEGERNKDMGTWIAAGAAIGGIVGLIAGIAEANRSMIILSENEKFKFSLPDIKYHLLTGSVSVSFLRYNF